MTPLTWLYVPGDRPERFPKAAAAGPDVLIIDLEDAVAAPHKAAARDNAIRWLDSAAHGSVEVRVNALATPWAADDLRAIADHPALRAIRLPKVESRADVAAARDLLAARACGLYCLIETAKGVECAYDIATAPGVVAIGLGEADLAADLGVTESEGLSWPRSRIVVAARAAGLAPPAMSVYPHVDDLAGLATTSRVGRDLGFVGRAAIHPRQLPVIAAAFRPTESEVADAHAVIDAFSRARERDEGVLLLEDGRMIDPALVAQARRILERAGR